ncbi:MAG: xanthine dehydrogenase family protein subunit M [Hyphomicrobiales bacterium]|nr:xanthine dehydrogenase family protein subunit M [Hyphomicrobiales bacterium]
MQFEAPTSLDQAVALLAGAANAQVLAGGTDLLVQIRYDRAEPELIVDIKRIPGMRDISVSEQGWRIGAAVCGAQIGENEALKAEWPGVVEAAELIGSTQIQGRATLAGNLCNASPAADSVPAMVAAGAEVEICGPSGLRTLAVEDVATGPGSTSLESGELVSAFLLPRRSSRTGDAYQRFIPRTEMDIAVVGVGICLTMDESGICTAARVALGAVAERVLLVDAASAAIVGSSLDDEALDRLEAAVRAACRPINDKRGTIEFRTDVAGVLAKRVARVAADRAGRV